MNDQDKQKAIDGGKAVVRIFGGLLTSILVPVLDSAKTVVKQVGDKMEGVK